MKLKYKLLMLMSIMMLTISTSSQAGRQGVNGYYGVGLSAVGFKDVDVTAAGNILFGIEEDGWGIEAVGFASVEGGTDIDGLDYSIRGLDVGLGYRSIEKNNRYYLLKYSKSEVDLKLLTSTSSDTIPLTGKTYSVGMGFRVSRENRIEVVYSLHSSDELDESVHFISLNYLWGGAPYSGKSF